MIKWPIMALLFSCMLIFQSCKEESNQDKPLEFGTVTDVDGNTYRTVKIGDQWWMAENLKASKFTDGTSISVVTLDGTDSLWSATNEPMYSVINDSIFGYLYNGYVLKSDKSIAPEGWHVATDEEWQTLERSLGMAWSEVNNTGWRGSDEAEKLTSTYSIGWPADVVLFGTNKSGFSALPSGCRLANGTTNEFGNTAFWWTSSAADSTAYYRYIDANETRIFRQFVPLNYGMAIRCVKNN
jgi:uncharacterized protein (TIGR02145 family)